MKQKILITGSGHIGRTFTLSRFPPIDNIVVAVPIAKPPIMFEIDGKKYTQRVPNTRCKPSRMEMIAAELGCGSFLPPSTRHDKLKLSVIELIQEYEKVLHKKSNLPRSQRDLVEHRFNTLFVEVT